MNQTPKAILLAAGESSRFWPLNAAHKSLFRVAGQPLITHTVKSLQAKGIRDIAIVQNTERNIEKELGLLDGVDYFVQPTAAGMGDAIALAQKKEAVLVFHAHRVDAGDSAEKLVEKAKDSGAKLILQGAETDQPELYGIAELEQDRVKKVVEKPARAEAPSNIRIVGSYLLPQDFPEYYQKALPDQYAFEKALNLYVKENDARLFVSGQQDFSLKYPWHVFGITRYLLDLLPQGQQIHPTAKIASNAVIDGNVYIGENAKIFEGAIIKGPCYIGKNCVVGSHALVRDYTNLEEGSVVGAFAEVARSIFQRNVHAHSGYFGDSILGEGCRVGAGTVTANVRLDCGEIKTKISDEKVGTSLTSLGVIVGENTHIGINVSLMPGVLIGSNCLIGPASVVYKNLADNATFFSPK